MRSITVAGAPKGVNEGKKAHGLKGRKKSAIHRLRISRSHMGLKHSEETRAKISQSMKKLKAVDRPPNPLSDMVVALEQEKQRHMDYFVMEKAVLELCQLRRDVTHWLGGWYARSNRKPSLEEVARMSPEIHNKFLRYIALQSFIRSHS